MAERANVIHLPEFRDQPDPLRVAHTTFGGGDGPGGGAQVDNETQRYVDKSMEAVRAQNDARFAEVRSGLDSVLAQIAILSNKVDSKPSLTWIIGVAVAGFLAIVAVLAFGGDRFDGGVQVQGTVSARTDETSRLAQENARQISEILRVLADRASGDPEE